MKVEQKKKSERKSKSEGGGRGLTKEGLVLGADLLVGIGVNERDEFVVRAYSLGSWVKEHYLTHVCFRSSP